MLVNFISALGRNTINFGRALGRAGFLLFGALVGKPQVRKHFPLFIKQLHVLGVQSSINHHALRFIYWYGAWFARLCGTS